ncbi:hypothetical protein GOP47_0030211 [Adiantum capillus-veneris]|nr:hypothetical protein GOP47_0030211 [Adiantum capillus-veneris]
MSVFTKAISPCHFFCQVARFHSATANDELYAMPMATRLPFFYQRTTHRLQSAKQISTYYVRAFSAVSLINDESHPEVVSPGVKRRGRPRKVVPDNGANSLDIPQAVKRRGRPRKNIIDSGPREPKRRGRPRKIAIDNGPKSSEDSTNSHAFYVQEVEQEHVPVSHTRQGHLFQYTDIVPEVVFRQLDSEFEVSEAVIQFVVEVSRNSIRSHGWFTIALPGGSLVKVLEPLMDEADIDWTKWHVCWVDERVVPLTDDDSNFKLAMGTWLSKAKIPRDQIHPIEYEDNTNVVARKYDQLMRGLVEREVLKLDSTGAFPQFDLILLGIGPDGHVASLFPNSLGLADEREWVVPVLHSPKPPPKRISMTLPCINAASYVCFVVVGSGKAEVIQRVLERPALPGALPAQMVRPSTGVLYWFVDKAAAQNLVVDTWDDPKKFPALNYTAAKKLQ